MAEHREDDDGGSSIVCAVGSGVPERAESLFGEDAGPSENELAIFVALRVIRIGELRPGQKLAEAATGLPVTTGEDGGESPTAKDGAGSAISRSWIGERSAGGTGPSGP